MTELYRFRSVEQLLGAKFAELERQTIFFAAPEDLNDPMEGLQDIIWTGDDVAWQNIFKNYADFLHWDFQNAVLSGIAVLSDPQSLPYAPQWQDGLPSQTRVSPELVWEAAGKSERMQYLVSRLAQTGRRVRQLELILYIREFHAYCLEAVRRVYVNSGIIREEDWPYDFRDHRTQTPVEKLDQAKETDDPQFRASLCDSATNELSHVAGAKAPIALDQPYSMLRIPSLYVEYLARIARTNWYTACFTKNFNNASMWGHYGGGHSGACLIFVAEETPDGIGLPLRETDDSGYPNKEATSRLFPPFEVRYGDRPSEVDFFGSIEGSQPQRIRESWPRDDFEDGSGLVVPERGEDKAGHDLETLFRDATFKTRDWEYEQEHRLILRHPDGEPLDPPRRTLTYDFMSLKGIVFGLAMSHEHKQRTMEIIDRKLIENNRTWFEYHESYYSPMHGDIRAARFSVALFEP